MTLMNSFHKTIKFTEEHSRNEIIFLDTYVKRDRDSLYTDLYVKETATHSYLHYTSCHPKNCTRKGPYGQFLRIKRNCTKDADFEKHAEDMKKHYSNRGYPEKIIQDPYCKAKTRDHHSLIHGEKRKEDGNKRIPLVLTYNPLNPNLLKIIKKHWQILHLSLDCKKLFPETPILAYRRNWNLRDTLVRASLLKPIQTEKDRKLRDINVQPPIAHGAVNGSRQTQSHAPQPAVRFQVQKHQLPREQRGIYIDLHTMQETIYWRNGKTVYWKMERTSLWHKGEKTVPGRTSFQRKWQSPKGHVPCQNIELNERPS